MISLVKLFEQKLSYSFNGAWISPDGDVYIVEGGNINTHNIKARELFRSLYPDLNTTKVACFQIELLKLGWIRAISNHLFEVWKHITQKQKDIIFKVAKDSGAEKITVDVTLDNGQIQLIVHNEPPEALYESKKFISRCFFSSGHWIDPDGKRYRLNTDVAYVEHFELAREIVRKKYPNDFVSIEDDVKKHIRRPNFQAIGDEKSSDLNYEDFLLNKGWITERDCNFFCNKLDQRTKDNIFTVSKEIGCKKIIVETPRKTFLFEQEPEALYESKIIQLEFPDDNWRIVNVPYTGDDNIADARWFAHGVAQQNADEHNCTVWWSINENDTCFATGTAYPNEKGLL
jgi:hypothetical protein